MRAHDHCQADHVSAVICSKMGHTQTGKQTDRLNDRLKWQTDRTEAENQHYVTSVWEKNDGVGISDTRFKSLPTPNW